MCLRTYRRKIYIYLSASSFIRELQDSFGEVDEVTKININYVVDVVIELRLLL